MGFANVLSNHVDYVDTKCGQSPVGSLSSHQLSHTDSNFNVSINVDSFPRINANTQQIEQFPCFPLRNQEESEGRDPCDEKMEFVMRLYEDEINRLEGATVDQANSEL